MNIQELRAKGIRVNKKYIDICISFSHDWLNGELKLPEIILNDDTVPIFLNLIASIIKNLNYIFQSVKANYSVNCSFVLHDTVNFLCV